jgi:hypothetical protein
MKVNMWLVEIMLMSLVGGTILGLGMHEFNRWRERVQDEHIKSLNKE